MIVTFISESSRKSRVTTRRIISKYLPQVGHDAWMGHIGTKAYEMLVDELVKKRSKYMSVSIWRHHGKRPPEHVRVIGSASSFDDTGWYVFRQKNEPMTLSYNPHPELRLLSLLVGIAALTHDFGKGVLGFQKKLSLARDIHNGENGKKRRDLEHVSDPVRHELLSLIMLHPYLERARHHGWGFESTEAITAFFDDAAEKALKDAEAPYQGLLKMVRDDYEVKSEVPPGKKRPVSKWVLKTDQPNGARNARKEAIKLTKDTSLDFQGFESDPLPMALGWLVLTHHKLPQDTPLIEASSSGGRRRRSSTGKGASSPRITPLLGNYINTSLSAMERIEDFFVVASTRQQPWHDPSWLDRFHALTSRLDKLLAAKTVKAPAISLKKNTPFVSAMMYCARPSLVYGDHYASSRSQVSTKRDGVFANTRKVRGYMHMADTLAVHLEKTQFETSRFFNTLFRKQVPRDRRVATLPRQRYPKALMDNASPGQFAWQNHLHDLGMSIREEDGMLALVMANTGTGKTRGCIKLAAEVSHEGLHCTLGLGLRTLADQSFRDYQVDPVGFSSGDVRLVMGAYHPIEEEASVGSSVSEMAGMDYMVEQEDSLSALHEIMSDKGREQATAPITAMTIDNIIQATTCRRGKDTHLLFNVMHSDLILDEIDNFSPEDLAFVTYLVFLSGFYGRKVILASATLNPVLAKAFGESYQRGWAHHVHYHAEKAGDCRLALVSSEAPYTDNVSLNDIPADEAYAAFVGRITFQPPTHLNITQLDNRLESAEAVYEHIHETLQRSHHGLATHLALPEGDIHYSSGFVRFSNVKHAQDLAVYLSEQQDSDIHHEVLCYHSKTNNFERNLQEYVLNGLMRRKSEVYPPEGPHGDILQAMFARARAKGKSHVALWVATTNIIEVGRDHCYDYCVLEPASLSSYIQSIGRVLRHRKAQYPDPPKTPNVVVLHHPMRIIGHSGKPDERLWVFPGIETPPPMRGLRVTYDLLTSPSEPLSRSLEAIGIPYRACETSRILDSQQMLGDALLAPTNRHVLKTPDRYDLLPEHALQMVKAFHFVGYQSVEDAAYSSLKTYNAGYITAEDRYKLTNRLGSHLRFRHETCERYELVCESNDGDYFRDNWQLYLSASKRPVKINQKASLARSGFLMHHIDRDSYLERYQHRFHRVAKGDGNWMQGYLFSIEAKQSDSYRFDPLLGLQS